MELKTVISPLFKYLLATTKVTVQCMFWDHLIQFVVHVTSKNVFLYVHWSGVLKHNRDSGPMRDPRMPSEHTGRGVLPEAIPPPFGVMPGMVASDYGGRRSSPVLDSPSHQVSISLLYSLKGKYVTWCILTKMYDFYWCIAVWCDVIYDLTS